MKINLCTYNFTLLSPRGNHHKKFESYFSLLKFKQLVVASISLHMYSQEHICTHIYNFVFQNIILLFFLLNNVMCNRNINLFLRKGCQLLFTVDEHLACFYFFVAVINSTIPLPIQLS